MSSALTYSRCDTDYDTHFVFPDILDGLNQVQLIDHKSGQSESFYLNTDEHQLRYRIQSSFPEIVADLLDLASVILAVDRLTIQHPNQPERHLHITLPVRNPHHMNQAKIKASLTELLYWSTGKKWCFEFIQRFKPGRKIEKNKSLILTDSINGSVVLWSGGLDAFAGLTAKLNENKKLDYVLLGTGSNDKVFYDQNKLFKSFLFFFPQYQLNLCQVPIRLSSITHLKTNSVSRARGIVFMLIGSACAYLRGQKYLDIYENGIGAINLPYRSSEIGLDHSRSVHPLTLLKTGHFLTLLFQDKFQIRNPFLFWTKAEMCAKIPDHFLVQLTSSCDSKHRKPGAQQCGYCSSCVLRRHALATADIQDKTKYVINFENRKKDSKNTLLALSSMIKQAKDIQKILACSTDLNEQWKNLTKPYSTLDEIVDQSSQTQDITEHEMQSSIIDLYNRHANEWINVESFIVENFATYHCA